MVAKDGFELVAVRLLEIAEQDTLVGREPERWLEGTADFSQGRFESVRAVVFDAAIFDVESVEPEAVALGVPAHAVDVVFDLHWLGRLKLVAVVLFDFLFESIESPIVDEVFESGDFSIGSIAEVALYFDDRSGDVDDLVGVDVTHGSANGGESFFCAGRGAEPAADDHVVADDLEVFADG